MRSEENGMSQARKATRRIGLNGALMLAVACGVMAAPPAAGAEAPPGQNVDGRAYELVSPAYKASGGGVGRIPSGHGAEGGVPVQGSLANAGSPAYVGERFSVYADYGSVLTDGGVAFASDVAFAERVDGTVGWRSHSPLTHPSWELQLTRFLIPVAASADLSRVVWSNNGPFGPFPEMGGWNIDTMSWGDWEGRWELLGPTDPSQVTGAGAPFRSVVSDDGSRVALDTGSEAPVRGLAGEGDPTVDVAHPNARNVYLADTSGAPADSFAGTGERVVANVCTGSGADRTRIPTRTVDDKITDRVCGDPLPGRDGRLVSPYGGAMTVTGPASVSTLPRHTAKNVVSADGRRVFFMSPDPVLPAHQNPGAVSCREPDPEEDPPDPPDAYSGEQTSCPAQLYVRQTDADGDATVRWISKPVAALLGLQDASLLAPAVYEGASDDGDKVFFRTMSPLTVDDPNGGVVAPPGGVVAGEASEVSWDLYMYDFPDDPAADPGAGSLTRVSGGPGGLSDCNNPQQGGASSISNLSTPSLAGSLRFVSGDGTRAYFVCAAPLVGGDVTAPAGSAAASLPGGTAITEDQTNLYLYDMSQIGADRWRFVARLPRSTSPRSAEVCASAGVSEEAPINAEFGITFPTTGDTGGNCMRGTSEGTFLTFWTPGQLTGDDPDATSADIFAYDAEADELERVSAPQTGDGTYTCEESTGLQCYADPGFRAGAQVGGAMMPLLGVITDPADPADRIAFFQSRSQLVGEDDNDVYDVYMWRNGELSLISSGGQGAESALYLGNDRSGQNVYFASRGDLSWQDVDAVNDVYTARVGGGIPEPQPPALCGALAGACQGGGAGAISWMINVGGEPAPERPAAKVRPRIAVAGLLRAKARRRAARSGVIRLRVRANTAGRIRVAAKAFVGSGRLRRMVRVGRGSARARESRVVTVVGVRLRKVARRELGRGGRLRVAMRVTMGDAYPRNATVVLRRAGK